MLKAIQLGVWTTAYLLTTSLLIAPLQAEQNDPTRPENYTVSDTEGEAVNEALLLTLIYMSEKQRYAVVNDKVLKEKDSVLGNRILEIKANHIVVSKNGVDKTLYLISDVMSVRDDE